MSAPRRKSSKAERTRARILEVAEAHFAARGFRATRLEDVAEESGLRRATLFYHFHDKRTLYRTVSEELFGTLLGRIEAILARPEPLASRLEASVEAWVDAVAERPSIARILLREAADARFEPGEALFPASEPFLARLRAMLEAGVRSGELRPVRTEPFHLASAIVGATVFYVAALRTLLPSIPFDPLAPQELAAHKRDVLRTARRLLGIRTRTPDPARGGMPPLGGDAQRGGAP